MFQLQSKTSLSVKVITLQPHVSSLSASFNANNLVAA